MKSEKPKKPLQDLNLLDRFLFAETMEDLESMQLILEIILGREVVLKYLPQAEADFNKMNDVYIIMITPFDLFGMDKYMYTFRMICEEEPSLLLDDGAVRIFLNTHGKNEDEVSPELAELLRYIENTTPETARKCDSERIHKLQERVQAIKSSEEVSVKYMQEWEERELERRDAREEGIEMGQELKLKELIKKLKNPSGVKTERRMVKKP